VNPVYSKVPVNRKVTQSRGATVDLVYILEYDIHCEGVGKVVVRDPKLGPSDLQRGHWYSIVQYSTPQYQMVACNRVLCKIGLSPPN
jgi:hypothetical protein